MNRFTIETEPSYVVESRFGGVEAEPSPSRLQQILGALDDPDADHHDPQLIHESGWCLSVTAVGAVVWQNEEQQFAPRHLLAVPPTEMLRLWCLLREGRIEQLQSEPWQFGLPPALLRDLTPRRDVAQERLGLLCSALGVAWGAAAFGLFRASGAVSTALLLAANLCLPGLFVGVLLTAIVRGHAARRVAGRDRRVARACFTLAALLSAVVVVTALVLLLPLSARFAQMLVEEPGVALTAAGVALLAGLGAVSPALIIALLAAERAKRA